MRHGSGGFKRRRRGGGKERGGRGTGRRGRRGGNGEEEEEEEKQEMVRKKGERERRGERRGERGRGYGEEGERIRKWRITYECSNSAQKIHIFELNVEPAVIPKMVSHVTILSHQGGVLKEAKVYLSTPTPLGVWETESTQHSWKNTQCTGYRLRLVQE